MTTNRAPPPSAPPPSPLADLARIEGMVKAYGRACSQAGFGTPTDTIAPLAAVLSAAASLAGRAEQAERGYRYECDVAEDAITAMRAAEGRAERAEAERDRAVETLRLTRDGGDLLVGAEEERQAMEVKLREACGGSEPSAGHDWADEAIGLLRVTRSQRDDADRPWNEARSAASALRQGLAAAQPVYCHHTCPAGAPHEALCIDMRAALGPSAATETPAPGPTRSPLGRDGWTAEDDSAEDAWFRRVTPEGGCPVCKGSGSRPLRADAGNIVGSIFCGPCGGSGRAPSPPSGAATETEPATERYSDSWLCPNCQDPRCGAGCGCTGSGICKCTSDVKRRAPAVPEKESRR